jgi:hypothetical protein
VKTLLVTAGPGEVVRSLHDLRGNAIARRDVERWITRQEIEQAEAERLASNRAAQLAIRRVRTMVAVSVMALGVMIELAIANPVFCQGCSTLSTELPLEESIKSCESGSISVLIEGAGLIAT